MTLMQLRGIIYLLPHLVLMSCNASECQHGCSNVPGVKPVQMMHIVLFCHAIRQRLKQTETTHKANVTCKQLIKHTAKHLQCSHCYLYFVWSLFTDFARWTKNKIKRHEKRKFNNFIHR